MWELEIGDWRMKIANCGSARRPLFQSPISNLRSPISNLQSPIFNSLQGELRPQLLKLPHLLGRRRVPAKGEEHLERRRACLVVELEAERVHAVHVPRLL